MKQIGLLTLLFALLFVSCHKTVTHEVDFYYWKSTVNIGETENEYFSGLNSKTLYLRFFDIDVENGEIIPKSKINPFDKRFFQDARLVPVVFITNRTFSNIGDNKVDWLVDRTLELIDMITNKNNLGDISEIQIDCDWTESTREMYFYFLSSLKQKSQKNVSCTLRLHQIKFKDKTGVPPVDRGVLMCYATSDPDDATDRNSILDIPLLKDYTANINSYPLDFDIALPLYSWAIVTNHLGKIKLLNNVSPLDMDTAFFAKKSENNYEVLDDIFFKGMYLNKGFKVKTEGINPELLQEAKNYLDDKLNRNYTIIYYHLDKPFLERFTLDQLK